MTTVSSSRSRHNAYARFIPREEVGTVVPWRFGPMDGTGGLLPLLPVEAAAAPAAAVVDEAALAAQAERLAAEHAVDREAAHAAGVEEGRAAAALEWQQRLDDHIAAEGRAAAERLARAAEAVAERLQALEQGMAQEVLQLACEIARQVVRQELSVNPNALQPVVREALGLLVAEGSPATVRLNPQDFEVVEQPLRDEFTVGAPGGAAIRWQADAAVAPGGCLVEAAGTVVDGSLGSRWRRAVATLGLESDWEDTGGAHGDGDR
ncbi:FliH/SctL family protein [Xylophilus sp.]|uniref:FliH/SctL family protein n=1 Tax=Xylophilus sp. TaxID=2653893 RepID=UPI0013BBFC8E|nr:flagellar assembly protein FliH [Xylophilus sp.]KAF1047631.1 MAG: hypothetical protein GAK38_01792 [Xylophilus sp.]